MAPGCAVAECKNSTKFKKTRPELIHHQFPKPKSEVRSKWIHLCKRRDKFNYSRSFICSDHFSPDAYQEDKQHKLLNLPPRKILKPDAIPTIFIGRKTTDRVNQAAVSRIERGILREQNANRKEIIKEILNNEADKENVSSHQYAMTQTDDVDMLPFGTATIYESKLDSQCNLLQKKDQIIVQKNKQIASLKLELQKAKNQQKVLSQKLKAKLKTQKFLSVAQKKIIQGKLRAKWGTDDIVKALSVRSISIKAYETARCNWRLPLPSVRTLRRWTRNFACQPGILKEVLTILKSEATSMKIENRICVLSFDEMSINSKVVIDKYDSAIVSSSKVQLVLARGICDGWKQPIYYDFDRSMNREILFSIIADMESSGYPVHAIVCDLGGENRSLLNNLNVAVGRSCFSNPSDNSRNIHVIADVPHMLKLLRNHVLDDGVILEDGTQVNKSTFQTLISVDNTEIKFCPNLQSKLVTVTGADRMRVRYAAQLFSHHTSVLAKKVFGEGPICQFIRIVNDGFDVLNSRVPMDQKNPLKSGLGLNWTPQLEALQNLRSVLHSCCFLTKAGNRKKTLLPFQKGWIMSIDSTLSLLHDLEKLYSLKYLLTSRITQDALESLFSCIRAFGGPNTCPTVPEFKYRLRLLLVGSQVRPPQGTNTDDKFENCSWVSAQLIQNNKFNIYTHASSPRKVNIVNSTFNEFDQLYYLAGFLAYKLKKKGFVYGNPTSNSRGNSWIHMLSKGGLMVPTDCFFDWIKECNMMFESSLAEIRDGNVKDKLTTLIRAEKPHIPLEVIKVFISVRLKIRATYLNRKGVCKSSRNRTKNIQFNKSKV